MVLAYGSLNEFDSASIYLDLFAVLKDSLKIEKIKMPKIKPDKYESEITKQEKKLMFYRRALIFASVTVFILILLIFFIKGRNR
jgi:hypothetical protein